ncbi:phosphotransferase family protein [Paenalkalicoccus suaedae]|uniref:phosphotransferase family protein n=1 Tax=Paenalkalicoccus suaedae TaxID=2592382 RepID=UPI00201BDB9D|nr:phosphotransferase family protein [Paenalkalicoccus suaedae]
MEHFMGEGWQLRPAGGATGEAYVAEQGQQKIFIKRNSSPFLAVLSAEGIVPKLLWTKRLESGDVITAQQWVNGRELKALEMRESRVAKLLAKIHQSGELLDMFKRMGNNPLEPRMILDAVVQKTASLHFRDSKMDAALAFLQAELPRVTTGEYVVCHADVHHNNWIEDDKGSLFLIDWDGAEVADPALDLAPLLYDYIPKEEWDSFLASYGHRLTDSLRERITWYRVVQCADHVLWCHQKQDKEGAFKWLQVLGDLVKKKDESSI